MLWTLIDCGREVRSAGRNNMRGYTSLVLELHSQLVRRRNIYLNWKELLRCCQIVRTQTPAGCRYRQSSGAMIETFWFRFVCICMYICTFTSLLCVYIILRPFTTHFKTPTWLFCESFFRGGFICCSCLFTLFIQEKENLSINNLLPLYRM